jgi:hypothetical protein
MGYQETQNPRLKLQVSFSDVVIKVLRGVRQVRTGCIQAPPLPASVTLTIDA